MKELNAHEEADRLWGECESPEETDHECQALRLRALESWLGVLYQFKQKELEG